MCDTGWEREEKSRRNEEVKKYGNGSEKGGFSRERRVV